MSRINVFYLQQVKTIADVLAVVQEPVSRTNPIIYTHSELGTKYKSLSTSILHGLTRSLHLGLTLLARAHFAKSLWAKPFQQVSISLITSSSPKSSYEALFGYIPNDN